MSFYTFSCAGSLLILRLQRHMEEIREARRNEAEAKKDNKKSKLEETKDSLRRPRKRKPVTEAVKEALDEEEKKPRSTKKVKKRVSFG